MVPKITSGGSSFKGAFQYYLHDKSADTTERIAWAETRNMLTDDPAKAWKVMAFTVQVQARLKEASGQSRAGRKLEKPVFAFSLSWHPDQAPDTDHMRQTALKAIETLGLSEHEAIIVAHRDEPQKHVHVIVNRVHPLTGLAGDVRNSKRKMSDFALAYERENGKIYCKKREENAKEREKGQTTHYGEPHIKEAWQSTTSGQGFVAALEAKGYRLAHGTKRIVVVDPYGKAHNPTRYLDGVKAKDLLARLADMDLSRLPSAEAVIKEQAARRAVERPLGEIFKEAAGVGLDNGEAARQQRVLEKAHQAEHERHVLEKTEGLAQKHSQESAALALQQAQRMEFAKKSLANYYDLKARKSELVKLREKIDRAPWWKRLLGLHRKDQRQFVEDANACRAVATAYRHKLASISEEQRLAVMDLTSRQKQERKDLETYLTRERERGKQSMLEQFPAKERSSDKLTNAFDQTRRPSPKIISRNNDGSRINSPERTYPS